MSYSNEEKILVLVLVDKEVDCLRCCLPRFKSLYERVVHVPNVSHHQVQQDHSQTL